MLLISHHFRSIAYHNLKQIMALYVSLGSFCITGSDYLNTGHNKVFPLCAFVTFVCLSELVKLV